MRTPIRIREAAPDDVADIVTLIAHLGYPVREEALQRTLELLRQTPGHAVLVAETYGVVCGLLVLSAHPSLTLQGGLGVVQELVVRPTQRRREIGESLLHSDSIVRKLVSGIDEEDWQEVEIIGWLYEAYVSERYEAVIGSVRTTLPWSGPRMPSPLRSVAVRISS